MFGRDADADDHDVGLDDGAVVEADLLDPCTGPGATGDPRDADAEADVDAVVAVQVGDDAAHLLAQATHDRCGERLDERDLETSLAGGGGDLGADEAGADDDHSARRTASKAARSSAQSSMVRSTCTPARSGQPGIRLGVAPVAMTRPSKSTCRPSPNVMRRPAASTPVARTPSSHVASRSSGTGRFASSGGRTPASTCLDSGGRS